MLHGSAPNESKTCRLAQFLRAFPIRSVSSPRMLRRTRALLKILRAQGVDEAELGGEGRRAFGVDGIVATME
jgi:hypothetical protein